jgi:uncharacterized Zn finger protein
MQIICDKCGQAFEPTKSDQRLVNAGIKKKMTLVMVECQHCYKYAAIDPRMLGASTTHQISPQQVPDLYRCPTSHCTGWVADISDVPTESGKKVKWGCGECGNVWKDDAALQRAISSIVARAPHRAAVYHQQGKNWLPVELKAQPVDYETTVESEPYE